MIKRRTNGYHNWRECTSTTSRILGRDEFTRIGVYRDGVGRLRCNRCFRLVMLRDTDRQQQIDKDRDDARQR